MTGFMKRVERLRLDLGGDLEGSVVLIYANGERRIVEAHRAMYETVLGLGSIVAAEHMDGTKPDLLNALIAADAISREEQ